MRCLWKHILRFAFAVITGSQIVHAQDPERGGQDLHFTELELMPRCHVTASVQIEGEQQTRFQYERFPADSGGPAHERLTFGDGMFQRTGKTGWAPFYGPGKSGEPVSELVEARLNAYIAVVNAPFVAPEYYDSKLGSVIWHLVAVDPPDTGRPYTSYIYERTREHPAEGASYPRFTFMKTAHDKDGELPLSKAHGKLRLGPERVSYTVEYRYELAK